jgi:hypothetical protein
MLSDGPTTTHDGSSSKTTETTTTISKGDLLGTVQDFPDVVEARSHLIAALDLSGVA